MPDIKWDEIDLLEFFEVEPIVGENGVSHRYEVVRNGLRMVFILEQYDAQIEVSLYREGSEVSLSSFIAYVRGAIRRVNDERGDYLEINDCILAPVRWWHVSVGALWSREAFPFSMLIVLEVKPDIRIALYPYSRRWDATVG